MPEKNLKDLYMGKSILDLKGFYELPKFDFKATVLCKSALKMYAQAEQYQKQGDEEMCYITLMKFLGLVTCIKNSKDYRDDKKFITNMLGPQKTKSALDWAEKLSKSLETRYKLKEESEVLKLAEKVSPKLNSEKPPGDFNSTGNHANSTENETYGPSISCRQLYKLLADSCKKILIFDVRPLSDYNNSHIKLTDTVHIPEEVVQMGLSAGKVESFLSEEAKNLYKTRGLVDYVVLMDWFSPNHNLPRDNKLSILKKILTEWDPGVAYKHEPIILQGGYQDWLETYPTFTTNPNVRVPVHNSVDSMASLLNKIEYVDFDSPPEIRQASTTGYLSEDVQTSKMPVIDRGSKPNTSSWKFNSGGTGTGDRTPKPASPNSKPEVSVSAGKTEDNHLPDNIQAGANSSKKQYVNAESRITDSPKLPMVDRNSKSLALKKYKEREQEMANLLLEQEETTSRSLKLAEVQVAMEDEWEKTREQKEMEADDEKRSFLQEQEDQLLQKIQQLEHDKKMLDEENRALRKALEKEQNENLEPPSNVEISDIEKRIRSKEEARDNLEKKRKEDAERRRKELEKARATKPQTLSAKNVYVPLKDENISGPSSQMKRSHSFPNLAQVLDDEAGSVKQRVPKYDRAIKPLEKAQAFEMNAARQRSWDATYGRAGRGLTGLKNLGNSCYMNSIIQCISNTTSLTFYFVEGRYHKDMNKNLKTCGSVVEEVAAVVRNIWVGQLRNFAAYDLKAVVGQLKSSFRGTEQQDSHEFLTLVMDWLHEELNKKKWYVTKSEQSILQALARCDRVGKVPQ